ncbi:hypothetical protein DFH06DRAFT_1122952 [Mycena polygramma]|nr:hypothetical protein DFH06DRAFT_1122952 [Mycena polygramma]
MAAKYHLHVDVCVVCAPPELDLAALARPAVIASERRRREQIKVAAVLSAEILAMTVGRDEPISVGRGNKELQYARGLPALRHVIPTPRPTISRSHSPHEVVMATNEDVQRGALVPDLVRAVHSARNLTHCRKYSESASISVSDPLINEPASPGILTPTNTRAKKPPGPRVRIPIARPRESGGLQCNSTSLNEPRNCGKHTANASSYAETMSVRNEGKTSGYSPASPLPSLPLIPRSPRVRLPAQSATRDNAIEDASSTSCASGSPEERFGSGAWIESSKVARSAEPERCTKVGFGIVNDKGPRIPTGARAVLPADLPSSHSVGSQASTRKNHDVAETVAVLAQGYSRFSSRDASVIPMQDFKLVHATHEEQSTRTPNTSAETAAVLHLPEHGVDSPCIRGHKDSKPEQPEESAGECAGTPAIHAQSPRSTQFLLPCAGPASRQDLHPPPNPSARLPEQMESLRVETTYNAEARARRRLELGGLNEARLAKIFRKDSLPKFESDGAVTQLSPSLPLTSLPGSRLPLTAARDDVEYVHPLEKEVKLVQVFHHEIAALTFKGLRAAGLRFLARKYELPLVLPSARHDDSAAELGENTSTIVSYESSKLTLDTSAHSGNAVLSSTAAFPPSAPYLPPGCNVSVVSDKVSRFSCFHSGQLKESGANQLRGGTKDTGKHTAETSGDTTCSAYRGDQVVAEQTARACPMVKSGGVEENLSVKASLRVPTVKMNAHTPGAMRTFGPALPYRRINEPSILDFCFFLLPSVHTLPPSSPSARACQGSRPSTSVEGTGCARKRAQGTDGAAVRPAGVLHEKGRSKSEVFAVPDTLYEVSALTVRARSMLESESGEQEESVAIQATQELVKSSLHVLFGLRAPPPPSVILSAHHNDSVVSNRIARAHSTLDSGGLQGKPSTEASHENNVLSFGSPAKSSVLVLRSALHQPGHLYRPLPGAGPSGNAAVMLRGDQDASTSDTAANAKAAAAFLCLPARDSTPPGSPTLEHFETGGLKGTSLAKTSRKDSALTFHSGAHTFAPPSKGLTAGYLSIMLHLQSARIASAFSPVVFVLVSATIQTWAISYLGHSLVGERTPDRGWAREGIGTSCSTIAAKARARETRD